MNEVHAGIESFSGTKSDHFNQVIGCSEAMWFTQNWTLLQHAYSPYCSLYIPLGAHKENLFNNQ